MSRDATIELPFADGDYVFRLAWGELIKLQEACDAGPYVILDRLLTGRWKVEEISNIIRLGLIGGGMDVIPARKLVQSYVETRPPLEHLVIAQRVLGAGVVGTSEEVVGKKSEAASPENQILRSQTESSDLPPSMETAS